MKPFVPKVVFIGSFGLFCFVFLCRPKGWNTEQQKPDGIHPAGLWTCLLEIHDLLFLSISPFWSGNASPMPVPPLHFGNR